MNRSKDMSRKLPEFTIGGTVFTVDARIYEFRERESPWNKISMVDFWEEAPTNILFDKQAKRIYEGSINAADRTPYVEMITVPPIVELDPIGLARHYNMPDGTFLPKAKSLKAEYNLVGLEQNKRTRGKKQQWKA